MEEAMYPDWSGLPEDLTAMVMRGLDIPDLFRAGAVCASWYAAYSAVRRVRIPIKDASPCLLYSCAGDGVPDPPRAGRGPRMGGHRQRGLQPAGRQPAHRRQVDLPPATGLHHVESSTDEQGRSVYNVYDRVYPDTPGVYAPGELRKYLYHPVCLSCSPSGGRDCILLLLHKHQGEMSYARLGDDQWTLVTQNETVPWDFGYRTAAYNDNDGLFYVVTLEASIYALDLNGPSPTARRFLLIFFFL